jgi:hypothetical protein
MPPLETQLGEDAREVPTELVTRSGRGQRRGLGSGESPTQRADETALAEGEPQLVALAGQAEHAGASPEIDLPEQVRQVARGIQSRHGTVSLPRERQYTPEAMRGYLAMLSFGLEFGAPKVSIPLEDSL